MTRRLRGERGTGTVTALVLLFAFTSGAVVWLARDVDRAVSNRSAAQSVAFQAARAGAQQLDVVALRQGVTTPVVSAEAARAAATRTAGQLLASFGLDGRVESVDVTSELVTVRVVVTDPAGAVSGTGIARTRGGS
jgi:hypothetical protein